MYGNGGAFGEDVLRSIVAGCSQRLVTGGWLMMVTYAPNVEEMPERLRQCHVRLETRGMSKGAPKRSLESETRHVRCILGTHSLLPQL